ncbi:hypothetical protein BYI23_D015090 (plasmid) [Burkholderia sp. YI23]|nr:hypothetical protein BYI23_D015090 [Burkholderia sp. YI23]
MAARRSAVPSLEAEAIFARLERRKLALKTEPHFVKCVASLPLRRLLYDKRGTSSCEGCRPQQTHAASHAMKLKRLYALLRIGPNALPVEIAPILNSASNRRSLSGWSSRFFPHFR